MSDYRGISHCAVGLSGDFRVLYSHDCTSEEGWSSTTDPFLTYAIFTTVADVEGAIYTRLQDHQIRNNIRLQGCWVHEPMVIDLYRIGF